MIDTAVLGLVWLHERDGGGPPLCSRIWPALGLPSHRPHDAVGDADDRAGVRRAGDALDARRPRPWEPVAAERRLESLFAYPLR